MCERWGELMAARRCMVLATAVLLVIAAVLVAGCASNPETPVTSTTTTVTTGQPTTTTTSPPETPSSGHSPDTTAPPTTQAPTTTTTEATGPQTYEWGSEIELAGVTVQVSEPQTDTALTDTEKLFLADGYGVVYVTVIVTNKSSAPYSYSPMNFLLSDSEGQVFTMSTLCSKPRLESGNLQVGRVVKGAVPFEIPEGSTPAYVDYFPTFDGVGTPDDLAATWGY